MTGTPDSPDERPLTQVLHAYAEGDAQARDLLVERTYAEIKRIAQGQLGGRSSTLQPTAIANEAFVRLFHGTDLRPSDRSQFFGLAAKVIRDLLVDHFRAKRALRRGGDQARVTLQTEPGTEATPGVDALDLCEALEELQQLDTRQHEIVELKFFAGLQMPEIAETLDVSLSTIERECGTRLARSTPARRPLSTRPNGLLSTSPLVGSVLGRGGSHRTRQSRVPRS